MSQVRSLLLVAWADRIPGAIVNDAEGRFRAFPSQPSSRMSDWSWVGVALREALLSAVQNGTLPVSVGLSP